MGQGHNLYIRRYKRFGVGVGLLCAVLALLNVAVPLSLYRSNMAERDQLVTRYNQLHARNNNLTRDRDRLQTGLDRLQNRHDRLTEQKDQLRTHYDQLTEQKKLLQTGFDQLRTSFDQLQTGHTQLTEQKAQLQTRYNQITGQKVQLQTRYNQITEQKDQLQTRCNQITGQKDQLQTNFRQLQARHDQLTERKEQLQTSFDQLQNVQNQLTKQKDQLRTSFDQLQTMYSNVTGERDDMKRRLCESPEWQKFDRGCYYISTETKPWEESRQWCRDRQSDLIVINSQEKQDFVERVNKRVWLGLTDREDERTYKWVDGTPLTTSTYWLPGQPNNREPRTHEEQDCVEYHVFNGTSTPKRGWNDRMCEASNAWICERVVC